MTKLFNNDDFQAALEHALGASYRHAADIGEVLATASRIEDGDADAWLREWIATAERVRAAAGDAAACGRRVSALAHYRRAATYYASALRLIAHSSRPDRELSIWRRQRECWERTVDFSPVPGERVAIPYQDAALPAYFFPATRAARGPRRPVVIINNGSDAATSETWVLGGAAAGERGYHWMTFDGPGQQAALYEQRIPFRPDWETVLTPVVDAITARPDVDPCRVAVIGVSQGGYWVPRALAFEHRPVAAVVDPGVVDVSTAWTDELPAAMRAQLEQGDQARFDREMQLAEIFSPSITAALRYRGRPYGVDGNSRFTLYQTIAGYRLGEEIAQITTPLLITAPEQDRFWPGQSQQLYDRLPGSKQLVRLSTHEGAGQHCEPLALALRETRIFDWLDQHLA